LASVALTFSILPPQLYPLSMESERLERILFPGEKNQRKIIDTSLGNP